VFYHPDGSSIAIGESSWHLMGPNIESKTGKTSAELKSAIAEHAGGPLAAALASGTAEEEKKALPDGMYKPAHEALVENGWEVDSTDGEPNDAQAQVYYKNPKTGEMLEYGVGTDNAGEWQGTIGDETHVGADTSTLKTFLKAHDDKSGAKSKALESVTPGDPPSWNDLVKTGEKPGGSVPGAIYTDKTTGQKWLVKHTTSPELAHNEALAGKLYALAGIDVPELHAIDADGKTYLASKWDDAYQPAPNTVASGGLKGVKEGFGVDAWLANWDVAGLNHDNVGLNTQTNAAKRIDVGGALLFRAQGKPKGDEFGDKVTETKTLLDPTKNPTAAQAYSGITEEQKIASAAKVAKISPQMIAKAVYASGFEPKQADELVKKLTARRKDLMQQFGISGSPQSIAEALGGKAAAEQPTPEAVSSGVHQALQKSGLVVLGIDDHNQANAWVKYTDPVSGDLVKWGVGNENLGEWEHQDLHGDPIASGSGLTTLMGSVNASQSGSSALSEAAKNHHATLVGAGFEKTGETKSNIFYKHENGTEADVDKATGEWHVIHALNAGGAEKTGKGMMALGAELAAAGIGGAAAAPTPAASALPKNAPELAQQTHAVMSKAGFEVQPGSVAGQVVYKKPGSSFSIVMSNKTFGGIFPDGKYHSGSSASELVEALGPAAAGTPAPAPSEPSLPKPKNVSEKAHNELTANGWKHQGSGNSFATYKKGDLTLALTNTGKNKSWSLFEPGKTAKLGSDFDNIPSDVVGKAAPQQTPQQQKATESTHKVATSAGYSKASEDPEAGTVTYKKGNGEVVYHTTGEKAGTWVSSYPGTYPKTGEGHESLETLLSGKLPPNPPWKKASNEKTPYATQSDTPQASQAHVPPPSPDHVAKFKKLEASAPKPTSAESSAIKQYTGSTYVEINNCLRSKDDCKDPRAPHLTSFLNKAKTTEPVTVYRGIKGAFANMIHSVMFEGAVFEDRGFISTSTNESFSHSWQSSNPEGILMHVEVPAGSKAATVSQIGGNTHEWEFLLQRGTRFRVKKFDRAKRIMHVEAVQDHLHENPPG
jgi:hypothetical protein